MIAALVAIVLAQQPVTYLPPDQALERVLPQAWREVVSAPQSVTLEGLFLPTKRSREVKVRWRRDLDEQPESVSVVQKALLDGASYRILGPGWGRMTLCGRMIPVLRLTFTREQRVVTADIDFHCGNMGLLLDEKGRQTRHESFDIAQEAWLEVFAPLVPADDSVAQRKRRGDEIEARSRRRALDGGAP